MVRLSVALFLMQAGFHGFTASMPLALARAGRVDSEIGFIVGVAALIQIPAALVAGALIDWLGGIRLFLVGGLAYTAAALLMTVPGVDPAGSQTPYIGARVLQGIGIGLALPAALSVVPRLVVTARQGVALAIAGLSHNLTLVILPPLSLIVLDVYGLAGVATVVLVFLAGAFGLTLLRPLHAMPSGDPAAPAARRRLKLSYRSSWAAPLAITVLFAAHWGLVIAYLPQRAELVGANVGLFFAADGIGVLLARVPSGWLADRMAPVRIMLAGLAITAVGLVLLLPTPTTALLVVSGAITGAGAALIVTPLLLALTRRSSDADRGSAFALFSAAFALALSLGSVGAAPIIDRVGFEVSLVVLLGALFVAGAVALMDRAFGRSERGAQEIAPEAALPPA